MTILGDRAAPATGERPMRTRGRRRRPRRSRPCRPGPFHRSRIRGRSPTRSAVRWRRWTVPGGDAHQRPAAQPHVATHDRQAFVDTTSRHAGAYLEEASCAGVETFPSSPATTTAPRRFADAERRTPGRPAWIDEEVPDLPKKSNGVDQDRGPRTFRLSTGGSPQRDRAQDLAVLPGGRRQRHQI